MQEFMIEFINDEGISQKKKNLISQVGIYFTFYIDNTPLELPSDDAEVSP